MAEATIENQLPHNDDAERLVLGAVLLGAECQRAIIDFLQASDFFDSRHAVIFATVAELIGKGSPIDLLSASDALTRQGQLDAAGGYAYLASLVDGMYSKIQGEHYACIIREKSRLRRVAHLSYDLLHSSLEGPDGSDHIIERALAEFSALSSEAAGDRDEGITFRDAGVRLLDELEADKGVRIFSDIDVLDRLTGGFRAGELVVFTAETGTGKTLLAQQTRRRACQDQRHSLFCSGEMLATDLEARELAATSGVETWKMRRPERLTKEDYGRLVQALAHECNHCRILDENLTLTRIQRVARRMRASAGLDCLILDYDELIDAPGKDEFDRQRSLVMGSKALANELKCPLILISQLRKPLSGEDAKRPTLARLYGSGAKAKHASIVIYVDRPFVRDLKGRETDARIVVVKNRFGKVGALDVCFNIDTLRFHSLELPNPKGSVAS